MNDCVVMVWRYTRHLLEVRCTVQDRLVGLVVRDWFRGLTIGLLLKTGVVAVFMVLAVSHHRVVVEFVCIIVPVIVTVVTEFVAPVGVTVSVEVLLALIPLTDALGVVVVLTIGGDLPIVVTLWFVLFHDVQNLVVSRFNLDIVVCMVSRLMRVLIGESFKITMLAFMSALVMNGFCVAVVAMLTGFLVRLVSILAAV